MSAEHPWERVPGTGAVSFGSMRFGLEIDDIGVVRMVKGRV